MAGTPSCPMARATVYTTLLSSVPPNSGCGWQTTAKAGTLAASPASALGDSTSACRGPAGPAISSRSARGAFSTMACGSGRGAWHGGEAHQQAVQAQHELRRVRESCALGELRLLVEQLRELAELGGIGEAVEISHQRVGDVHLEERLHLGRLLARGREDPPQPLAEIVLAEYQACRGLLHALADAHLGDALAECVLDALQQPLALLEFGVVALTVG